ncbi:MAG TPA: hypothetical protein VJM11_19015, partial [Nevskiaceae bacterium]|nr:hypothetical protein [Nevskiaceae bacterium]
MPTSRKERSPAADRAPADSRVKELNFDDDRRIPPRTGEPVRRSRLRDWQPPSRARKAGLTGGSIEPTVDGDVTGDDLSPETLIDPQGAESPIAGGRVPADQVLRRVTEEELTEEKGAPV